MQSVTISAKVVSSSPVHGEVYSMEHSVIKFVSDLRYIGVLRFPPPIKLIATTDISEILLKVALNVINNPPNRILGNVKINILFGI